MRQTEQEFPEYREQEYIGAFAEALQRCNVNTIYVPTEGTLPVITRPTEGTLPVITRPTQ